jgi:hypothetical protein
VVSATIQAAVCKGRRFFGKNHKNSMTNVTFFKANHSSAPLTGMDEKTLFERLDRIIAILQDMAKPPPLALRIVNGIAIGAGILSILTVVELLRSWIGG